MYRRLKNSAGKSAIPIVPVSAGDLKSWLDSQPAAVARWLRATAFKAMPGQVQPVPDRDGDVALAALGMGKDALWCYAALPGALPAGSYRIDAVLDPGEASVAALGWALGTYAFDRYRETETGTASMAWPKGANRSQVRRTAEATALVRDLINTPASDLGPEQLADAVLAVGRTHGARVSIIEGDALLRRNYPTIHAVGRASARAPRLVDLRWGTKGPRVTLVGKGVCFDSGGLDLKTAGGMKLMKKDMGGAAHVLGLATMIMDAKLPVRLRLLVPAVENSVSGNAMRPLDVIKTRKGLTVEVGNTDAEGRLILCDALAEADRESPDLIVDCATLTGAARVALGTDLPALFCADQQMMLRLMELGTELSDPLWPLPLYGPYRSLLDSKVADLNNISEGGYAGAITAALFLQSFVSEDTTWIHIDLMGWNTRARPGRPVGGEAMGMRALYALIEDMARPGR
jgi:leucyl aminopeptidase